MDLSVLNKLSQLMRRRAILVAMLLAIAAAIAGGRTLVFNGAVGSEDNVLFYMMGQHLVAGDQMDELATNVINHFTKKGANDHVLLRLQFRKTYLNEFPLPGAIYLAISRALKSTLDLSKQLYPLFLAQSLLFGFMAAIALSVLASGAAVGSTRRPVLMWAFALTILLFGLSEFLPLRTPIFGAILHQDSVLGVLHHTGLYAARPGPQFSPLGFPPRGNFALILIGVFALRWSGRYVWSYALVLLLSFVHLSYSGLVFAAFLVMDLFLRPHIFKQTMLAVLLLISFVVIGTRQTLWVLLGENGAALGVLVLVAVAALAVWSYIPALQGARDKAGGLHQGVRGWFLRSGAMGADLKILSLGWLLSAVLLYAILQITDLFEGYSVFYFWGRLHGRMLMLFWPSVIFGLVAFGLYGLASKGRVRRHLHLWAAALCVALLVIVSIPAVKSLDETSVATRMAKNFFRADRRLSGPPLENIRAMGFGELVIYYGIAKSVDTGRDHLVGMLR